MSQDTGLVVCVNLFKGYLHDTRHIIKRDLRKIMPHNSRDIHTHTHTLPSFHPKPHDLILSLGSS